MTTRTRRLGMASGILLLAAALPARAERFADLTYLAGLPGVGKTASGTLFLEGGELRFEDGKGRALFVHPIAAAEAWVGVEQKRSAGCILGSIALAPVFVVVSAGQYSPLESNPLGSCLKTRGVLMIKMGPEGGGVILRCRVPRKQEQAIADAINRAAHAAAPPAAD